ncbi:MAG: hypothetical protein ACFHX7_19955 [Pseudomonadota bacterium]
MIFRSDWHTMEPMETYLVGGAVRDRLLGRPVTERDWVVVGATPETMTNLGFRSVGRDFPVFLHPRTSEEYALARTERKTGRGHRGFECHTEAVTLEDDLLRRDLTINAIAESPDGALIDPWGGCTDLANRVLRHVSPAFGEDPLRVLRVARFAASLADLDFRVHADTMALMQQMVDAGELAELAPERILGEFDKALATPTPNRFFEVLQQLGADLTLWPELAGASLQTLVRVAAETDDLNKRTAGLLQDLVPEAIDSLATRIRLPRKRHEFARLAAGLAQKWLVADQLTAAELVELLHEADGFRQPARLLELNSYWQLALPGENTNKYQLISDCIGAARSVNAKAIGGNIQGPALGAAIRSEQVQRVARVLAGLENIDENS